MPTFVEFVGVPASGKSYYAENIANEYYDALYLSSDCLRVELLGDVNDQKHNKLIFREMFIRTKQALDRGISVVYDATNLNRKKRAELLAQLPACEKICYWFDIPVDECIRRDAARSRCVGERVIKRMNCQLEVPTYDEGWDKIIVIRRNEDVQR